MLTITVLLSNKRDFSRAHINQNCYQIIRADFWDFISNETNISRKLLPDTKDVFWTFISNNTDAIGDSGFNTKPYVFFFQ